MVPDQLKQTTIRDSVLLKTIPGILTSIPFNVVHGEKAEDCIVVEIRSAVRQVKGSTRLEEESQCVPGTVLDICKILLHLRISI
jgi:hypothetical protein